MESMETNVAKTCVLPNKNSPMLPVAAILLIVGGVIGLVLRLTPVGQLYWVLFPPFCSLAFVTAGILLFLGRNRPGLELWAPLALLVGCAYLPSAVLLAAVLMLLSTIGLRWNVTPSILPKPLQIPVLNLAAVVLTLLGALQQFKRTDMESLSTYQLKRMVESGLSRPHLMIAFLVCLLPFAGIALLNLSMEVQERPFGVRRLALPNGEKYKKGLGGLAQRFYHDVGGSLQRLAKFQGFLCLVVGGLSAACTALGLIGFVLSSVLDMRYERYTFTMLLLIGAIGVVSALLLAISTWFLYAFGQITSDIRTLRDGGISLGGAGAAPVSRPQEENPDELPEL